jgi:hypothetical protein
MAQIPIHLSNQKLESKHTQRSQKGHQMLDKSEILCEKVHVWQLESHCNCEKVC